MDMLACDLTDIPAAGIGAGNLVGQKGACRTVPADEGAAAAGTIAYDSVLRCRAACAGGAGSSRPGWALNGKAKSIYLHRCGATSPEMAGASVPAATPGTPWSKRWPRKPAEQPL